MPKDLEFKQIEVVFLNKTDFFLIVLKHIIIFICNISSTDENSFNIEFIFPNIDIASSTVTHRRGYRNIHKTYYFC